MLWLLITSDVVLESDNVLESVFLRTRTQMQRTWTQTRALRTQTQRNDDRRIRGET